MKALTRILFVIALAVGMVSLSGCQKKDDDSSSSTSGFFPRLGI